MAANCAHQKCPDGTSLPNCYYGAGSLNIGLGVYEFVHYVDSEYSCIPCCMKTSNNNKMPG